MGFDKVNGKRTMWVTLFFKTQLLPNNIMRVAICDTVGRTFYAEFIVEENSRWMAYNYHKFDAKPYNPKDPELICENPDAKNVANEKEVSMFGTENMVRKYLKEWLGFYDKDCNFEWIGDNLVYDVMVIEDLLDDHIIYRDYRSVFTEDNYCVMFINPLKFVKDLRLSY